MTAQPSLFSTICAAGLSAASTLSLTSANFQPNTQAKTQANVTEAEPLRHRMHQAQDVLSEVQHAVAVIRPTKDKDAYGAVRFEAVEGGVRVTAMIKGLQPGSKHGFHIHEFGDATKPDATSAGSHYDPANTDHHARPGADEPHHAGDMGNLEANEQGIARFERTFESMSIAGSDAPVIGRAVVVHAEPDEFDQPLGSAGARIGIGVIGVANPEGFGRPLWE